MDNEVRGDVAPVEARRLDLTGQTMEATTKTRYQICLATTDDVDELVRMQLALQESMAHPGAPMLRLGCQSALDLRNYYRTRLADEQTRLLVAKDGQAAKAVGMGMGRIWVHASYTPTQSGELIDIWIEPDHRCKGLAGRITARLLHFFRVHGIEFLAVNYVEGNRLAETMWKKLGFNPVLVTATAERCDTVRMLRAEANRIVPITHRPGMANSEVAISMADLSE